MIDDGDIGYWEFALGARLRMANGNSFQTLFNDFMIRVHGDDFTPVKPHGNVGDGGMDGHFVLNDTVYQCYGADNGHVLDITRVCRKMRNDFERARSTTEFMKEWRFAHNLVDGVPRPMIDELQAIKEIAGQHGIKVGFFGLGGFRSLLAQLSEADKIGLLGVKAINDIQLERLPDEIELLVGALMKEIKAVRGTIEADPAPEVPENKFEINDIPEHWRNQIEFFLRYSFVSREVVENLGDPRLPLSLPAFFRLKYEGLRDEHLTPTQIMLNLKSLVAGHVADLDDDIREFATMVLLADLFESCVIFEQHKETQHQEREHDPAN